MVGAVNHRDRNAERFLQPPVHGYAILDRMSLEHSQHFNWSRGLSLVFFNRQSVAPKAIIPRRPQCNADPQVAYDVTEEIRCVLHASPKQCGHTSPSHDRNPPPADCPQEFSIDVAQMFSAVAPNYLVRLTHIASG